MSNVDLIIKWICRGLDKIDLGVKVDMIARWIWKLLDQGVQIHADMVSQVDQGGM